MIFKQTMAALAAAASLTLHTDMARADVPTAAVCKSFASYAIRWNTRARQIGCKLPTEGANWHFDERRIVAWCMGRPNDDRSPQALGHKALLEKSCGKKL